MLMPVTQAMIEAALSKIREADYDVPYAVVSVALEAAERARWQPIETAPKSEVPILFGWRDGKVSIGFWDTEFLKLEKPTHWQPLPSPPETK